MDVHIGCSGYYYSNWGEFYPSGLKRAEWLSYYSLIFDTVELNSTFYRQPRPGTLARYVSQTPDDFLFSVKVSRYITHILRLGAARPSVDEFQCMIRKELGSRLSAFLFQLPPSFHYSPENMERVLHAIPSGPGNVVEFRHESWWNENGVHEKLRDSGITFCNVDFPGLTSHFVPSGADAYVRFHGNPVLFKSAYSDDALQQLIQALPPDVRRLSVYFNNTNGEAAINNAATLQRLMTVARPT